MSNLFIISLLLKGGVPGSWTLSRPDYKSLSDLKMPGLLKELKRGQNMTETETSLRSLGTREPEPEPEASVCSAPT